MIADTYRPLVGLLRAERCSCVIRNGDTIRIFRRRGIADLYALLRTEPDFLRGAFVADKVVGKGAAALMVLGGIGGVYAGTVSRPARGMLERSGIQVYCSREVEQIHNRAGDGTCPVEVLCRDCTSAAECLPLIAEFVERTAK